MKRMLCIILLFSLLLPALPICAAPAGPQVPGKSALLMDVATGAVLYEQNPHEKLPPASVTKVMTMLLIMEAIDTGAISWEEPVTASESAAAKGGSQIYLKVGEQMSVRDMLKSIAVSSANDAACAMAEHLAGSEQAFVDRMNRRAQELGMADTHFVNCTGLDDDPAAKDHLTSAYDIALMSRELLLHHPQIQEFTTIWMDSVRNGSFGLSNTNKLVRFYPGATGLKTGFTSAAGYCLSASARRDGLELVAVVLGAESSQDRFSACKQLLDFGFANFSLVRPKPESAYTVPVQLGTANTVAAVPARDVTVLVEKGQLQQVRIEVKLTDQVAAPVSQGQKLGDLTVYCGEQVLSTVPMVAETAVLKRSWWQIFLQLLQKCTLGG